MTKTIISTVARIQKIIRPAPMVTSGAEPNASKKASAYLYIGKKIFNKLPVLATRNACYALTACMYVNEPHYSTPTHCNYQ